MPEQPYRWLRRIAASTFLASPFLTFSGRLNKAASGNEMARDSSAIDVSFAARIGTTPPGRPWLTGNWTCLANVVPAFANEEHLHSVAPYTSFSSPRRYHSSPVAKSFINLSMFGTLFIDVTRVPFSGSRPNMRTSSGST